MNIFTEGVYSIKDSAKILGVTEYHIEYLISKNKIKYSIDSVNSANNAEEIDRINRLITTLNEYAIIHFNDLLLKTKNKLTKNTVDKFIKSKDVFKCMLDYYGYDVSKVRIVILGRTLSDYYNKNKLSKRKSHPNPVFVYVESIYLDYYKSKLSHPDAKYLYSVIGEVAKSDSALQFIITGKDSDDNYELNGDKKLKFSTFKNWCTRIKKKIDAELLN